MPSFVPSCASYNLLFSGENILKVPLALSSALTIPRMGGRIHGWTLLRIIKVDGRSRTRIRYPKPEAGWAALETVLVHLISSCGRSGPCSKASLGSLKRVSRRRRGARSLHRVPCNVVDTQYPSLSYSMLQYYSSSSSPSLSAKYPKAQPPEYHMSHPCSTKFDAHYSVPLPSLTLYKIIFWYGMHLLKLSPYTSENGVLKNQNSIRNVHKVTICYRGVSSIARDVRADELPGRGLLVENGS